MQAILLAAGVGRRLASLDQKSPKCLLSFGGKTLLERHLEILQHLELERVLIVVGHEHEMIRDVVARWEGRLPVEFALNEDFRRGSIISLATGLDAALGGADVIVMDADVLYHPHVLRRLVEAPFANGFLLDPRSSSEGEEMMLGVKDDRVCTISRNIGDGWDLVGEGVGFFRVAAGDIAKLKAVIESMLQQGLLDADYESAIDGFLRERPAHYVTVADLAWTEIDFDEDVDHAREVILPRLPDVSQMTPTVGS